MSEIETKHNMVSIKIDGVEYKAREGEYILNAARANNLFIPAICYLTRCSPTLACRICLVEADGKQVYACNAKVKDGMEIRVDTPNILKERRAIMEVYDVNHPLQCGVCDQSGECELQNYTLELEVDSQSYTIADTKRETKNWSSVLHYDAGLCIVCERCTTVCKDMIGDSAIKTTKRGGPALDKALKGSMPKDAYAMWNKLQKSIIAPSNGTEYTNCSDCGECVAVCPVGALVSRDFQYTTNAWDLKRVPATCAHCSSGCQIYYEVKPTSISDRREKIYRVTNEFHYVSLCGAGRFGYDFENRDAKRDPKAFTKAIEAFKKAKVINFTSVITNEEALMLQTLKEKLGFKLINREARAFQIFLEFYKEASGKSLYTLDFKQVMGSDFVISLGISLRNDNPNARYAFNNVQKLNKGAGFYFHPVGDNLVPTFGKNIEMFTHKVGEEELGLLLLLELFADKDKLPKEIKEQLDREKLLEALGKDSAKFDKAFTKMMKKKESFALIVGEDLYFHKRAKNIANLIVALENYSPVKVAMVPPKTNSLGVALICDLDDEANGYTVGYNALGDFRLSALGDGDLDIPALNQQEGTFTNMNKRVLPTNVALDYDGYVLNDIVQELIDAPELTIEWTPHLPKSKGFKAIEFDALPNRYLNDGTEDRGYRLDVVEVEPNPSKIEKFDDKSVLDGQIAYRCNPQRQFNDFTNKAHQIFEEFGLYVSPEMAKKLSKRVIVELDSGNLELDVIVDDRMAGDIVAIPDFKSAENVYELFGASRYQKVIIREV
jgi:NADH-quinone oxidoreductase subunit G